MILWQLLLVLYLTQPSLKSNDVDFKNEILTQVNLLRSKGCKCGGSKMKPAQPLVWDDKLEQSAREHATDMDKNDFFEHDGSDGRDFSQRIFDKGFNWSYVGENIAWGQKSISEVVESWRTSPTHCLQMMHPKYTRMGVAK
nr:CAP domain-containing protein [Saprospiraceae bacterium]